MQPLLSTRIDILLVPNPLFPVQRHLGQFWIFGVTVLKHKQTNIELSD